MLSAGGYGDAAVGVEVDVGGGFVADASGRGAAHARGGVGECGGVVRPIGCADGVSRAVAVEVVADGVEFD